MEQVSRWTWTSALALAALAGAPGCVWVSDQDLSDRQASLIDVDGDGYQNSFGDGDDCDDGDGTIHPGAAEIWYDDVDQDCAGGDDFDADADGFAASSGGGQDCDDQDSSIYPGAPDPWYDGTDQDCDGNDADQDLDGYDWVGAGGDDCDDMNVAVNPGVSELWYDGFDQDCDGANDYDADADGYDGYDSLGDPQEDCDDGDAGVNPGAAEIWYDGVDQDCDGGGDYDADGDGLDSAAYGGTDCFDDDASRSGDYPQLGEVRANDCGAGSGALDFTLLDLHSSTGVVGPRLDTNAETLGIAWGYETAFEPGFGLDYDGLGGIQVRLDDPEAGEDSYDLFAYNSDAGDFGEVLDLAMSADYYLWADTLLDDVGASTARLAWLDIFPLLDSVSTIGSQVGQDQELTVPFEDVQVELLADDEVRYIACEESLGTVYIFEGTVDQMIANSNGPGATEDAYVTRIQDASGSRCEYWAGRDEYVMASAIEGTLGRYQRSGAQLIEVELTSGVDIRDIEAAGDTMVAAEATEGLLLWDAAGNLTEPMPEIVEQLDVIEISDGVMICTVDAAGAARLYYGDSAGLESIDVGGTLGSYDDCGIAADPNTTLVYLGLRSGDDIELAFAYAP